MQLRMWMYDLAREQAPTYEHLRRFCDLTLESGYSALGLYLEHRFAYPSTSWAHGRGSLEPEVVEQIQRDYPELQLIPFVNLLGHFEGMLYTEEGKRYREERFRGMQACPSNAEFVGLAKGLIDDVLATFKSRIVHIGGDETQQLGKCPKCSARVENAGSEDGKAVLYGEHFGPLAQYVIEQGRRPAVWGDMYLEHPTALEYMPKETLIFDWQYFYSPLETSRQFRDKGFEVVCCPTLHVYNAPWLHIPQSEANVRQAVETASSLDAYGVCVTTWEAALLGNYETLFPAIKASGKMLDHRHSVVDSSEDMRTSGTTPEHHEFLAAYDSESLQHGEWARLMGVELQQLGGSFAYSGIRSSLKVRLLLQTNPFLAWLHHQEEFTGEIGDGALAILDEAIRIAPDTAYRGVSEFVKAGIEFVRFADQSRQAYANHLPGVATSALTPCRQIFENLEKTALATHLNIGGSLADVHRCRLAKEHVERVIKRIKEFGDGHLGYLPAFEHITHPSFVPHDQGAWWLINRWAIEGV